MRDAHDREIRGPLSEVTAKCKGNKGEADGKGGSASGDSPRSQVNFQDLVQAPVCFLSLMEGICIWADPAFLTAESPVGLGIAPVRSAYIQTDVRSNAES